MSYQQHHLAAPPTANSGGPTEPSYAACGKTCASNGPPRIIRERPSAPRLCLCHVGAIGCHWETRRGMGLRQATLPRYAVQHSSTSHCPSARSRLPCKPGSTWPSTPPPSARRRAYLSLLCWRVFLAMFVPSSNERPVGRYPSPSPLSRFSSSCISFHFTPFRGPMLPAGPSLFKSPLPRLQWLPDLQDMGPDWGPRSLRSVFYPGSPSSQRRGPPSPVPGPLPTPCLPRHRWADATLAGLRLPYAAPCQRTPRLPPPPLLPHPPTTVPLYLVPPPAAAKRSLAHLMYFSCPQTQSGLCQEIRLSSYRRSELDRAEARCPPPASPRLGRRHYFPSFSLIPPGSCTAPPSGPLLLPSRRPTIKPALVVPPRHWKSLLSSEPAWPNTFPTLISVFGL